MSESVKSPQQSVDVSKTKPESKPTVIVPSVKPYAAQELKAYLRNMSAEYGIDYPEIAATVMCESGWKTDLFSKTFVSYGVSMFRQDTFSENCTGKYKDAKDQLRCMARIWEKLEVYKGKFRPMKMRWDCFRLGLYKKYL